jgi:hypothetical protein
MPPFPSHCRAFVHLFVKAQVEYSLHDYIIIIFISEIARMKWKDVQVMVCFL